MISEIGSIWQSGPSGRIGRWASPLASAPVRVSFGAVPDRVKLLTDMLIGSRASGVPILDIPPEAAPRSIKEAYLVQDAVAKHLPPIDGWKIGRIGEGDLFSAPLHRDTISGPRDFSAAELNAPLIEVEIAFVLLQGVDLPLDGGTPFADVVSWFRCSRSSAVAMQTSLRSRP